MLNLEADELMQKRQMSISIGKNANIIGSPIGTNGDVTITNNHNGSPHQPNILRVPIPYPQRSQIVSPTSDDSSDRSLSDVSSASDDISFTSFPKVMLSYNWNSSSTVNKIYKNLRRAGFQVWLDKKDMEGDMYESMEKAVRQSDVVIACLSGDYENSANAMKEAKHAAVKNKHIIPILVEENYRPSGAVDFIISGTIYIDFCSGSFDRQMKALKTRLSMLKPRQVVNRSKPSQTKPMKSSVCVVL